MIKYEPKYTKYTDEIIEDIRESLKEVRNPQVVIDTFDLCDLLDKIDYLESLIKDDIIDDLNEISNKRIGYGQTEVDKWWLKQIWNLEHKWIEQLKGGETMACGRKKGGKKR